MHTQITGHGFEMTQANKDYIEDKLSILESHFQGMTSWKVVVKKPEGIQMHISAEVHMPKGTVHADALHQDFYAAVDLLKHKLIKQIDKHHDHIKGD